MRASTLCVLIILILQAFAGYEKYRPFFIVVTKQKEWISFWEKMKQNLDIANIEDSKQFAQQLNKPAVSIEFTKRLKKVSITSTMGSTQFHVAFDYNNKKKEFTNIETSMEATNGGEGNMGFLRTIVYEGLYQIGVPTVRFTDAADLSCTPLNKHLVSGNRPNPKKPDDGIEMAGTAKIWLPLYDENKISLYYDQFARPVHITNDEYLKLLNTLRKTTLHTVKQGCDSQKEKVNVEIPGLQPKNDISLYRLVQDKKEELNKPNKFESWCTFYNTILRISINCGIKSIKDILDVEDWEVDLKTLHNSMKFPASTSEPSQ